MTHPMIHVEIPDPTLDAKLREVLNLQIKDPIHESKLQAITDLHLIEEPVTNLTGLEKAIGLQLLSLDSTSVSNVSPLAKLHN